MSIVKRIWPCPEGSTAARDRAREREKAEWYGPPEWVWATVIVLWCAFVAGLRRSDAPDEARVRADAMEDT